LITSTDPNDLSLPDGRAAAVSIGVFDGVHLGHQAILRANVARARASGLRPTVVTFQQHPKQVLLGRAPRTLTTLEHRLELFRRLGIEHTLALVFDDKLRQLSARDFATDILADQLRARTFVLGFDSKFGSGRAGDPELLRSLDFDVEVVPQVLVDQRAVSSTAIREAVELGDLNGAARMLGRPVSVFGDVVHGDAIGANIGFPTANLDLHHELHPPNGVYSCRARRVDREQLDLAGTSYDAVANIGLRPTVTAASPPQQPRVEVHLLDFEGDLYGEHIELEFVAALRGEMRFPGLAELQAQIQSDVLVAREHLARADNPDVAAPNR
jgi:riboflavin kinase/FMN adenylyltransferase